MYKAQISEAFPHQSLNYSFAVTLSLNLNCKLLVNAAPMTGLFIFFFFFLPRKKNANTKMK